MLDFKDIIPGLTGLMHRNQLGFGVFLIDNLVIVLNGKEHTLLSSIFL